MQAETVDEGWVKLHRKILNNPIMKDSEAFHLLGYFLLKANHKANRFLFNQREIVLDRGQLITGLERISKDTGLTYRQIRTRLALLENLGILTRKTTNRFSIITICNYSNYQDSKNDERQADRQSNDKQTTTNKNDKNEKSNIGRSKKEPDPRVKDFLNYWAETFQKEIEQPYVISFGKESKLAKSLLQVHPLEALQDAARAFFRDEQCKRRGLTIGIFYQEINRLMGSKGMNPLEQAKRELQWGK
jgi:hypothetical protein